jgi:hypothetical protein
MLTAANGNTSIPEEPTSVSMNIIWAIAAMAIAAPIGATPLRLVAINPSAAMLTAASSTTAPSHPNVKKTSMIPLSK